MRNNFQPSLIIRKTAPFAFILLACLAVTACGGGISGTGDGGGPIVIIMPESSPDSSISDGSNSGTATSDTPNEVVATGSEDLGLIPALPVLPSITEHVPNALFEVHGDTAQVSTSEPFTQQLILIASELNQLQSEIETNSHPVAVIESNYFDYTIEHSESGKNTSISWSADSKTISILSTNSDHTLNVLQEDLTLTVRRFDRANNVVFQATLNQSIPDDSSEIIEAVLNTNGILSYLRTITASAITETAVFTQHPTEISAIQQRELISLSGTITDIQTCTASNSANSCLSQDDWFTSAEDGSNNANDRFTAADNSFNSALALSPLEPYSLPENVNTAVIAGTDNSLTTADQVQCGLQVINEKVKVFCLQPQPLEVTGSLFQEQLSGGQVFYQLLP